MYISLYLIYIIYMYYWYIVYRIFEGSLEVKLPTIWQMKSRDGNSQRREEKKKEDQKRESLRRKKIQVREKVGKVAKHCVFPMICGSGGSKSRLAKAAGAEPCGEMRDKKLHAVVARNTFPSQNVQSTSALEHFWKLRCRKARRCGRSTFRSQNVQSTPWSDNVWKLRCR